MNSTSQPATLADRAEALTQRNNGANPAKPPAVAVLSPIHEILLQEVAASLPPELRTRMEAEPSVERVMDWLGAGALARWVANDPIAAHTFWQTVGANPAAAGLALARALAARMAPPVRVAAWHRADRLGLAWQLLVAAGVLLLRVVLFAALGWVCGIPPFASSELRVLSAFGLGLVFFNPLESILGIVLATCAGIWLLGEAFLVSPFLERIRQAPARRQGLAPPVSWRLDAFHVVWRGQALLLVGTMVCRLGGVAVSAEGAIEQRLVASLACLLVVGLGVLSVRRAWSSSGQA